MTGLARTVSLALLLACLSVPACRTPDTTGQLRHSDHADDDKGPNTALEWNQILIDTLITTSTPNSSSQRLGAIVHAAMFDAYNGITREYAPIYYAKPGPDDANPRAAIVAASYTALVGLFPSQKPQLDASYAAALAVLANGSSRIGIDYGKEVAQAVLRWRAADGFNTPVPVFKGGTAIGQWQPTPPAYGGMSAQTLAFTKPFVVESSSRFRPVPPRGLLSQTYADDFNAVKALGRRSGSTRTEDQTALAYFWEGNATVHWNQAANQAAQSNKLGLSKSVRLLAVLNIAMADTAITTWSAKRHFGADPVAATWRPVTAIPGAASDGNPATAAEAAWLPLINTPSHPEYPAGHPSLNGAAATVLLSVFDDAQSFTLTAPKLPDRTYSSISRARADGNNGRVWGGMHYPSTVAISDAMGETIAKHIDATAMQNRKR